MTLRMPEFGISRNLMPSLVEKSLASTPAGFWADMVAAGDCAAAWAAACEGAGFAASVLGPSAAAGLAPFLAVPPEMAASTSCLTMRPLGPLPWIWLRSRPDCSAMRLASGLAKMRLPPCAGAAGGLGTFGFGGGA